MVEINNVDIVLLFELFKMTWIYVHLVHPKLYNKEDSTCIMFFIKSQMLVKRVLLTQTNRLHPQISISITVLAGLFKPPYQPKFLYNWGFENDSSD
jgi:hypothetical protein